jgi:hypothetical protein
MVVSLSVSLGDTGFEFRALYLLGRHSTTYATAPVLFALVYFSCKVLHLLSGTGFGPGPPTSVPLPPVWLGLQMWTTMPGLFVETGFH